MPTANAYERMMMGTLAMELTANRFQVLISSSYYSGQRTSSPRSIATPMGPDRLTLPPGRHQPSFNSRQSLQVPSAKSEKQSIQYVHVNFSTVLISICGVLTLAGILHTSHLEVRKRNLWRCLSCPTFSLVRLDAPSDVLRLKRLPIWVNTLCSPLPFLEDWNSGRHSLV